jgi:outer membrane protein assembly factor BamB
VPLSWIGTGVVVVLTNTGDLFPKYLTILIFVPATLWVLWFSWMFYQSIPWGYRLGVLVICWGLLVGCISALEVQGLTGDAKVNFAWRWQSQNNGLATAELHSPSSRAGENIDLTKISSDDYPQFLGPQRLGVVPHGRLARDWKTHPPREIWRHEIGLGWSSFAIVGNYAITQEQRGPLECVVCYRVSDGEMVWIHTDSTRFDSKMGGHGPRATPTIAEGKVYTLGATGVLNCLEGATGKTIWSLNILEDNKADLVHHGVCASPLIVDEKVIVCPTGENKISLAAYDKKNGRRIWQGGEHQASYGSPLLAEIAGVRQILLYNSECVTSHDVSSGKVLWFFSWPNGERVNCSQPIPHAGGPGKVFVSTGYDKGSALFQVHQGENERWSCNPIWESRKMKTKFTTAVIHDGRIFGLDEGILACLDLETGRQLWKGKRYKHGQILLVGNLLLIQAEEGEVVLGEPTRTEFKELGRIEALSSKTWNNPALAGRYLLVRNDREAVCYELAMEAE